MVLRSWSIFSSLFFLAADSSVLLFSRCNPDKSNIINRDLFICNNALDKQFVFKQDVRYIYIQFFLFFFFSSPFSKQIKKKLQITIGFESLSILSPFPQGLV